MTFNDNADISSGKVSRRGRNTAIGVGGGGVVGVVVLLISLFTGVDLTGLAPTDPGAGSGSDEALSCTVEEANTDDACRVLAADAALRTYWSTRAPDLGFQYVEPQPVVEFDQGVSTACGSASAAMGPFYCPADQTIYLDISFYNDLRTQFGASGGPLAQLYIIGHEFGHHIQHISGITEGLDTQNTGADSDSVRLELQADCFAGAWLGDASKNKDENGNTFLDPITEQQIADALNAAAAVGDDHIQEQSSGQVNPDGWTHGSSEQRQKWFMVGYDGSPDSCNTFEVSGSDL